MFKCPDAQYKKFLTFLNNQSDWSMSNQPKEGRDHGFCIFNQSESVYRRYLANLAANYMNNVVSKLYEYVWQTSQPICRDKNYVWYMFPSVVWYMLPQTSKPICQRPEPWLIHVPSNQLKNTCRLIPWLIFAPTNQQTNVHEDRTISETRFQQPAYQTAKGQNHDW